MDVSVQTTVKSFTGLFKGHYKQFSKLQDETLRRAFAEFPESLRADGFRFEEIWVNEGGEPVPMTRCTVKLVLPVTRIVVIDGKPDV